MRGKYPGILLTADTYNLFGSNLERGNAKRKEKSWLLARPFYKHKMVVTGADGVQKLQTVPRLVMEYASMFNNIDNTTNGEPTTNNTAGFDNPGEHEYHSQEDNEGGPRSEV